MKRHMILLFVLLMPLVSSAMSWQSLWLRPDQQGARLLAEKKNKAAATHFQNPRWKAAALYRAGAFRQAAKRYSQFHHATDDYNQGNAWAKVGHYQQAIDAYQVALQKSPDMQDAKHNLVLVKKLLQQKQKSSSQRKKSQSQKTSSSSQQQSTPSQPHGQQQQSSSSALGSHHKQSLPPKTSQAKSSSQQQTKQPESGQQASPLTSQKRSPRAKPGIQKTKAKQAKADDNNKQRQAQKENAAPKAQNTAQSHSVKQQSSSAGEVLSETQAKQQREQAKIQQWLAKVPDDPGGLLRRKFLRDYQRRQEQA